MENGENIAQSVRETIKDVITEVEKQNNIKTIFGDPIREKGVVLIPVGTISTRGGGGGGGGGMQKKEALGGAPTDSKFPKDWGSGLGVGYARNVRPLGFIEIKDDKAVFKPIVDAGKIVMVAVGAAVLGACMIVRTMLKRKTRE